MKKWINKVKDYIKTPDVKKEVIKENDNDPEVINNMPNKLNNNSNNSNNNNHSSSNSSSNTTTSTNSISNNNNNNNNTIGDDSKQKDIPTKQNRLRFKKRISSDSLTKLYTIMKAIKANNNDIKANEKIDYNYYLKEVGTLPSTIYHESMDANQRINITSTEMTDILIKAKYLINENSGGLFCVALIGFHHKKGTMIEYVYPSFDNDLNIHPKLKQYIEHMMIVSGMPDSVHNAPEDHVYFIMNMNKTSFQDVPKEEFDKIYKDKDDNLLLYGVSCFKQIAVTEEMKKKDPEITRSHLQKAVCVLSRVPTFGLLHTKLDPTTKAYFNQNDFQDTAILRSIHDNINSTMSDAPMSLNYAELLMGIKPKKLVTFFGEKLMLIWKALFLEKRILVYSNQPSVCSAFMHSLLSLYPTLCHFKFQAKSLNIIESHYIEYGIPLRFFHSKCLIIPYFSLQNLEIIDGLDGYLGGTSNKLLKTLPKMKYDIYLDIDANTIEIKNDTLKKQLALSKKEKQFIGEILKKIKVKGTGENSWSTMEIYEDSDLEYEGSNDWIRSEFYNFLKDFLTELAFFYHSMDTDHICDHDEDNKNDDMLDKQSNNENEHLGISSLSLSSKNEIKQVNTNNQEENVIADIEVSTIESQVNQSNSGRIADHDEILDEIEDDEEFKEYNNFSTSRYVELVFDEAKSKIDRIKMKFKENVAKRKTEKVAECQIFKEEVNALKQNAKELKNYNIEWILEWTKTSNFAFWAKIYSNYLHNRSKYAGYIQQDFIVYENGDIYYGELYEGIREGNGKHFDRDQGTLYVGQWHQDKRHGEASVTSIISPEYLYDGQFKDDLKHGYGKLITSKERYVGNFKFGKYDGSGILIDDQKNVYDGEYQKGFRHGMGKLQCSNGDAYTGEFVKDTYHGKGQLAYANGDFYSGDFRFGMKNGYGYFANANGESYEGKWKDNLYHGSGILTKQDGTKIEGEFNEGLLIVDKEVIIHYPNGDIYQGFVLNEKPHGKGIMKKANGELQESFFINGECMDVNVSITP